MIHDNNSSIPSIRNFLELKKWFLKRLDDIEELVFNKSIQMN